MPPPLGQLVRNIPTVAPVPHRSVLSVAGPQASEFLNGLIATSIREGPKRPQFSTFLHAQGRVLYDVFLYSSADLKGENGYLIEYDSRPSKAPPLLALLKRYVLRSKVRIQDASERYDVWAAWNTDARDSKTQIRNWKWARSGVIEPVWDTTSEWPWGVTDEELTDRRAIGMGRRILVRKGDYPRDLANHDLASSEVYTNHRILHGVAEGIDDIPPMQAFPIDSNLDVMGGLDFRKGCYVGQELTVRTYHTGVVRKRILPVTLQSSQALSSSIHLPVGLDITSAAVKSANGNVPIPRPRGTGKLLTTINGVGLALLRLEQVEGVERNEIQMQLQSQEGHDGAPNWTVSHWWPDWWPREPRNE